MRGFFLSAAATRSTECAIWLRRRLHVTQSKLPALCPTMRLDAYWQRATVFAMLGFAEGFGLVYAEAMRRGLPVVASMEDAGQEINVDGNQRDLMFRATTKIALLKCW